jgi:ribosomal-protein-alanine N-acetyltransferase
MLPIQTQRLIIRHLTHEDVEALARLWTDPQVTRYMGGPREYQKVYNNILEDAAVDPQPQWDLWPVVERETGAVIGHCGLADKEIEGREEIELVYVFAVAAWGKGYASEAAQALVDTGFGPMGLERIVALVEPENDASARVAVKAGLHLEKQVIRPSGRRMNLFVIEKENQ